MRNVKIMGDGVISGGEYDDIRVMGNGKFLAKVKAEKIGVYGNAVLRDVEVREMNVFGSAQVHGTLVGKSMRVFGEVETHGPVKCENIVVKGYLRAQTDVQAESFTSYGGVELIALNANDVKIHLHTRSLIQKVGAESVVVSDRGWWGLLSLFGRWGRELRVDLIEADQVRLRWTTVETVKGNNVWIGPGCRVKLVEYRDQLDIEDNSVVEKSIRI